MLAADVVSLSTQRSVLVRVAVEGDASGIAECMAELGYGTPPDLVRKQIQTWSGSVTDVVLVATTTDQSASILGAASVHIIPLLHQPGNLARLTSLAVRFSAQRLGVGAALVRAAESFAQGRNCPRIEVTSGDARHGAHAFYEEQGYKLDSRRFLKRFPPAGG